MGRGSLAWSSSSNGGKQRFNHACASFQREAKITVANFLIKLGQHWFRGFQCDGDCFQRSDDGRRQARRKGNRGFSYSGCCLWVSHQNCAQMSAYNWGSL